MANSEFHRYAKANASHAADVEQTEAQAEESALPPKKKWWVRALIKVLRLVLALIFVLFANHVLSSIQ